MNQNLPFAVWIAHADLLAFDAWDVDAYTLRPQPWEDWHANGWTPNRAIMELSTPATPYDLEDGLNILPHTVTTKFAVKEMIMDTNIIDLPNHIPATEEMEINLRFLDIQNPHQFPVATRQDKIGALQRLSITVQPHQTPLQAWLLAMRQENDLPKILPAPPSAKSPKNFAPTGFGGWPNPPLSRYFFTGGIEHECYFARIYQ